MSRRTKILPRVFFERPTLKVAEDLIGKFLVRQTKRGEEAHMITETEAYDGPHDLASHAARGKTARNAVMFGEAGVWYVYLCYGIHWMANIVTGPKGYPAAVLIRSVDGATGPGRVTKLLSIDKRMGGAHSEKESGLRIEDRGIIISKKQIKRTPRIGVAYAGPVWAEKKYRFVLEQ